MCGLLLLHFSGGHVHCAKALLQLHVGNHLKSAIVFSLLCPKTFFSLSHFSFHFSFLHLARSFVHNAIDLVLSQTLEVVRLKSVVSQHALCRIKLLSHKIMCVRVILLVLAPPGKVLFLLRFPISLLLCKLKVGILRAITHKLALILMSLLCLFQLIIEVNRLLMDHCLTELLLLFNQLLLANLLLGPVSHLHCLHPDSVPITCKKRFSKDVSDTQAHHCYCPTVVRSGRNRCIFD